MEESKSTSISASYLDLGPLEAEVMELVWASEEASVRDVYHVLLTRRQIAYTTVMTVMSNLADKGVLKRRRQGRAYLYLPVVSRDDFTRARIIELVDGVAVRFTESAMNYLVDRMEQIAPHKLAELEESITRLRKERQELSGD